MATTGMSLAESITADQLVDEGERLLLARETSEALRLLYRAEQAGADPDRCAGARWHCWMLRGDFARAWEESDGIRRRGRTDPNRFWTGESPAGKRVMVRSLHGFGDAVQNLRFLQALRAEAAHVTLEVAPPLQELARYFAGADEVITWGSDTPATEPVFDMQIEITELPYLLRCGAGEIARGGAYLSLPAAVVAANTRDVGPAAHPRVAVAWMSSQWDTTRSVPFCAMNALLASDGVEFWSLQTALDNDRWREWSSGRALPCRCAGEGSMLRTAAMLTHMDLVITVDTFVAHLAGALGRPVWLLLKQDADWRWGLHDETSVWYPTLRLFRQERGGCWTTVLATVKRELAQWQRERM